MALLAIHGGMYGPIGEVDLVDTEQASILGGEVMTLTQVSRTNTATEKAASDARDGYLYDSVAPVENRPAATRASLAADFPLFLADDGTGGYGTLFGQVIGTPTGLLTTGTNAGPHTAAGSGKVTLWDKAGRYSITIDALAGDFVSALTTPGLAPGAAIGFGSGADLAKLAHAACANLVTNSGVATFYEFRGNPSLVRTPDRLVGATETYDRIVVDFHAGLGVRTT